VGKISVTISTKMLDPKMAMEFGRAANCGAELLFLGTVRNVNEGRRVEAVNYDGHVSLSEKVLRDLCLEAASRWGEDLNFWLEHRLGRVAVGEVSLIVYVTAPHRDSAYQASRYVLEQIKQRLPVWKEELYCEGEKAWLSGQTLNR
jgi:molybdopterin synthase catalytic subunit